VSDPTDFSKLKLKPELFANLSDLGYTEMTLVQAETLPLLIDGADVLARAKTGSGKTAAFGLGILNSLDAELFKVQTLVLCPTRELADQVAKEIRRLARAIPNIKIMSVCGGAPLRDQTNSLQRSPHIIVGTPGRVHKHLRGGTIDLANLQTLVLDEADRMLDMGFMDELDAILAYVPSRRQTLLFSATYPEAIADVSARIQRNPKTIDVTGDEQAVQVTQTWCSVTRENRNAELVRVLRAWGGELNLVFCNTRIDCAEVARYLQREKIVAIALHGDLDQAQRYELSPQAEVYVHRIGRTGRAGKTGVAVSLVEEREMWRLEEIEKALPDALIQKRGIPDAKRGDETLTPRVTTIQISGGRKNKLRPGDLLGALTAEGGIPGDAVGSIDLFDSYAYVAVKNAHVQKAQRQLNDRPIKGRKYRARVRK